MLKLQIEAKGERSGITEACTMAKSAVIFRSSPRENGNTNSLTDAVSAELKQSGCRVTEFDLNDMDIRPCTSCRECQKDWTVVNCAQYDDFGTLAAAVKESDMIVLSTPRQARPPRGTRSPHGSSRSHRGDRRAARGVPLTSHG